MKNILVLSGRGRFADQWHDLAATSHCVASILAQLPDVKIEVRSTFRTALDDIKEFDLLVLNISRAEPGYVENEIDGTAEYWQPFVNRIVDWTNEGGKILALHSTTLAAESNPELKEIVGGNWIEGISGHPPIGKMTLELNPIMSQFGQTKYLGLITPLFPREIDAFDERYCRLAVSERANIMGWVRDDPTPGEAKGVEYPALWINRSGLGVTIYSGLGHDARSFASPTHQQFVFGAAGWLLNG